MAELIAIGSANADVVLHVACLPRPGETVTSSGVTASAGGKSANQAVAAARLGASVGLIAVVGGDQEGKDVLRSLTESGVDVSRVLQTSALPTGKALICVDADGQNTIVVDPGANAALDLSELRASELSGTRAVLLCNEAPVEAVRRAASLGRQVGATVIWNPSPWRTLDRSVLRHVDVIVVNEEEYRRASGTHSVEPVALHKTRDSLGVSTLVVTLGASGAVMATDRNTMHRVPAPTVTAVDTTGCGDAFLGAFAAGVVGGKRLDDGLEFAATVGAFAATRAGAQSSYPSLAELDRFARRITASEVETC